VGGADIVVGHRWKKVMRRVKAETYRIDEHRERRIVVHGDGVEHLIDERAAALPLPDGCAAIPPRVEHRILWWDPLSALAVLAKCSAHVWLRAKTPSLAAAIARREVSLLIPPAFAARLPKEIR
jgi:hypothetical protein